MRKLAFSLFILLLAVSTAFATSGPLNVANPAEVIGVSVPDEIIDVTGLAGGCAYNPCTDATTDGDGSTALLLCEQVGAADFVSGSWSATGGTYEATSFACGDSYQWRSADSSSSGITHPITAQTQFTSLLIFRTPNVAPASYADIVRYSDDTDGDLVWLYFIISPSFQVQLRWKDASSSNQDVAVSVSANTVYVSEIWWQDAQADAGIRWFFYEYGTARTEIDLTGTTDSTLDATAGLETVAVRHDADYQDNDGWEMEVLKIRSGASFPPGTCCD